MIPRIELGELVPVSLEQKRQRWLRLGEWKQETLKVENYEYDCDFDCGCFQRDRVTVYKEAKASKAQNASIVVFV